MAMTYRPMTLIRVVDLETTGFEPPAEVIQIGCVDLISRSTDLIGSPCDFEPHVLFEAFVKPTSPIPPETSAIHHIIDADVADGISWKTAIAEAIGSKWNHPTILAAHSAKFERRWLTDEITGGLPWICTYKAALRLWPDAPSHSNQCLRYWRKPEGLVRKIASVSHRAMPDAYVTAFLLRDMLNDGAKIEDLIAWTSQPALQVTCRIGNNRGLKWRDVDDGFLEWISVRDFDEDVLFTVNHEMERRRKECEAERGAAQTADLNNGIPF